ncbi:hypothetical protein KXZ72_04125 [Mycetocola spongiae]|nr:hypothetical protein KXZ72_04125 [Mycetocola spongiae]
MLDPHPRVRAILDAAVERLAAAGARTEALGEFIPAQRKLLITRKARLIDRGRVWRLGVFLLSADGVLRLVGITTRAVAPGWPGHQSLSAETRREYRDAAHRGPFREGETINFDAPVLDLDERSLAHSRGVFFLREGLPVVRWSADAPADSARDLGDYLAERIALLIDPPAGA